VDTLTLTLADKIVTTLGHKHVLIATADEAYELADVCNSLGQEKTTGLVNWFLSQRAADDALDVPAAALIASLRAW
jgi:hypothetical protein